VAIRALQQVYAGNSSHGVHRERKRAEPQRTTDPAITDLLTALDHDAAEDREE
jgi:hypothetical protein